MWALQSSMYVMSWQFSFSGQLNWIAAEAKWRLLMEPNAATDYEIAEAACFVGEHRGGRPRPWADDAYTGTSWADVCMTARDQQEAAEQEREDTDGEFNDLPDQHEQTRDDPPYVSDESTLLDLNDFAAELNTALENHDDDDDPDDDNAAWSPFGAPPPGAPPAYRAVEANAMAEEQSDDESTAAERPMRPRHLDGLFDAEAAERR